MSSPSLPAGVVSQLRLYAVVEQADGHVIMATDLREAADHIEALEELLGLADEVVATAKQVLENGGGTTNGVSRVYDVHEWVMGNASLLELIPAYLAARALSLEHEAVAAILSDYHATRMPG